MVSSRVWIGNDGDAPRFDMMARRVDRFSLQTMKKANFALVKSAYLDEDLGVWCVRVGEYATFKVGRCELHRTVTTQNLS